MRILLGLIIVAVCATPAFAGKGKHEKNIAKLDAAIAEVVAGPAEPNRTQELNKLELKRAYQLFLLHQ